jgi:hypothetical protein
MLTTLNKFKDYLEIPLTDTSLDVRLTSFLNAASNIASKYCNTPLIETILLEYNDGSSVTPYILTKGIIQELIAVTESATPLQLSDVTVKNKFFIFKNKGKWLNGGNNVIVEYKTGFTSENVPADIELAVTLLAEYYFRLQQERRNGRTNSSKGGESVNYLTNIPDDIKVLLDPYVVEVF